jgi:hypothetical protein
MKRLLLVLVLVLLPSAVFAQSAAPDRDVLLTTSGTLFTVESELADSSHPEATQYLVLTAKSGQKVTRTIVPESTTEGLHRGPALAYDPDSETLFVFWLRSSSGMSSEVLAASYQNGKWGQAISIDDRPLTSRYNLRIAMTRRVAQTQRDGSVADVPMTLIHAVWWESKGNDETPRYAMLPVDRGRISLADPKEQIRDLNDFASVAGSAYEMPDDFNLDILRHPSLVNAATLDAVDVIFGDVKTKSFNRTTLRPIMSDGRLHIPIGASKDAHRPNRFAPPDHFSATWNGRVDAIANGRSGSDRLLFYNVTDGAITYIVYADGKWSSVSSLPLNERLSVDATVTALSRMINLSE